jgi:hypothetical protein
MLGEHYGQSMHSLQQTTKTAAYATAGQLIVIVASGISNLL